MTTLSVRRSTIENTTVSSTRCCVLALITCCRCLAVPRSFIPRTPAIVLMADISGAHVLEAGVGSGGLSVPYYVP